MCISVSNEFMTHYNVASPALVLWWRPAVWKRPLANARTRPAIENEGKMCNNVAVITRLYLLLTWLKLWTLMRAEWPAGPAMQQPFWFFYFLKKEKTRHPSEQRNRIRPKSEKQAVGNPSASLADAKSMKREMRVGKCLCHEWTEENERNLISGVGGWNVTFAL